LPCRAYNTVDTEILIMRVVCSAKVATISPVETTVLIAGSQTLVYPVPDKAALHVGCSIEQLKIFREITQAVTHGMGKFAHDKGTGNIGARCIFSDGAKSGIHRCHDVSILVLSCLFEQYRT